jgi:hypothetical protein
VEALADAVGDQTVGADHGHQERDGGERGHQHRGVAAHDGRRGVGDQLVHGADVEDGGFGFEGADLLADGGGEAGGGGAGSGADDHAPIVVGTLREGEVDDGSELGVEADGVLVADDAEDLHGGLVPGEVDALADRVLVGEGGAGEAPVDQDDVGDARLVALVEGAAGEEREAEGVQVARADVADVDSGDGRVGRAADDLQRAGVAGVGERQRAGGADAEDASCGSAISSQTAVVSITCRARIVV